MSTNLVTYDGSSTDVLHYSGGWFLPGTWADASGNGGSLSSTNDPNAYVSFTFPIPAISVTYYGILRSRGGQYEACIDCDPSSGPFTPVNGFDASDNGKNAPIALFSRSFQQPGVHTLIMRNANDPRGTPAGNSQLTLDRIVLQVRVPEVTKTTTSTTTSMTTSTSTTFTTSSTSTSSTSSTVTVTTTSTKSETGTTTQSAGLGITSATGSASDLVSLTNNVPTTSSQSTASFNSTSEKPRTTGASVSLVSSKSSQNIGVMVGGVLGGLAAIIACTLLLLLWLSRQRRRRFRVTTRENVPYNEPVLAPIDDAQPAAVNPPTTDPSSEATRASDGEKSMSIPPTPPRGPRNSIARSSRQRGSTPSRASSSMSSSSHSRMIPPPSISERDSQLLSPFREEDDLPPEYSQF